MGVPAPVLADCVFVLGLRYPLTFRSTWSVCNLAINKSLGGYCFALAQFVVPCPSVLGPTYKMAWVSEESRPCKGRAHI